MQCKRTKDKSKTILPPNLLLLFNLPSHFSYTHLFFLSSLLLLYSFFSMILAGDQIDLSLGVMFGITTMCAAALGNILSDNVGVMLGTVIEDMAAKLGLPQAKLSRAQMSLRKVRFSGQAGCAVGITIGCIIGMFPLLFIDSKKIEKLKKEGKAHIAL
jgi:ribose/xylose/arabinose/galactoside ABC-type transport system permease subunit